MITVEEARCFISYANRVLNTRKGKAVQRISYEGQKLGLKELRLNSKNIL